MNRFFKAVLLTGLFVGTTDLLYAFTSQWMSSGKFADHMLKGIASVAVGRNNAFPGNDWIAFLGLFFHYFIAFAFTLFFDIDFEEFRSHRGDLIFGCRPRIESSNDRAQAASRADRR